MKGKKGICLILCILLLTGLAPLRAAAVSGEQVDGVWASVALTGGANKIIFSADSEIEQQILYPAEQTAPQYLLPEGVSYDSSSNTLSLTNFNAPTANLVLTMMGADFKIRLSGSNALASICSESKGRGGSVTLCGDGSLELAGGESAILVRAGGAPDFVRVELQARLTASSTGSVIRVVDSSLTDGAIVVDNSEPQVTAYDARHVIESVTTTEGETLEPYTLPGSDALYGIEDDILSDSEGDRIVYNVFALGERTDEGLYPVLEEAAHNTIGKADADGVTVTVASPGITRAFHPLHIQAKGKLLTIPARTAPEAYGKRARELSEKLFFIRTASGVRMLATPTRETEGGKPYISKPHRVKPDRARRPGRVRMDVKQNFRPVYWLRSSVTVPQKRNILPSDAALAKEARAGYARGIEARKRVLGL
ncbi:MAG: hypothetical protein IKD61_07480 [Oscillospiraceae bacterium]|nr:hypothetical protein [Oscillospiraceae bacterium]